MKDGDLSSRWIRGIRWISFLPLAFVVSSIAGALAKTFMGLFSMNRGLPDFVPWTVSAFVQGAIFVIVGLRIAPKIDAATKWLLAIPMIVTGVIAALGGAMTNDPAAWGGVAVAFVGIAIARMSPEKLLGLAGRTASQATPPTQ